ncbi:HPr family phosphocarrier protein [Caproiciproducens galactitolivorans]|uniref:HPr-like protein Crh n=1 Tax=Caproiciproducens galactitolivorans TaxID=642589 RepID=A0A4Z0YEE0_9FIRM|nr:HPr family phosphocarrier protein [Caproiciproducens galactitolivorans]QEY35538.1 HPr family phosphocarrier protein [Caproiciproducens galactitolivorans]TGJ77260.1 HPr-like protein Crh [Caproiciproducens galactitolivorans]
MIRVKITDRNGLHARPAGLVTSIAQAYPGEVFLEKGHERCNAKNIFAVMALEAEYGDFVNVIACGKNSEKIEKEIEKAIQGFDEASSGERSF